MLRFLLLVLCLPIAALAQTAPDPAALAGIRAELDALRAEIGALRSEFSAPAPGTAPDPQAGPAIVRLDKLEAALGEATGRVEQMGHRLDSIVKDGTLRLNDLEFRLVELEGGDPTTIGAAPPLGGDAPATLPDAGTPAAPDQPAGPGIELAVSEKSDFEAAKDALAKGDATAAISAFDKFLSDYPGGPLSSEAMFHKGEALAMSGQVKAAARSFLDAFSAQPTGAFAARSLMKVGVSLGMLGQTEQACTTLGEVLARFPGSDAEAEAATTRTSLGCS